MPLTKRQKEVMEFITEFVRENGYSPSYEELAGGLKLASVATVHKHISSLETKQYLNRAYNQSRSLQVTNRYLQEQKRMEAPPQRSGGSYEPAEIPLLGRIAAGAPIESVPTDASLKFSDFTGNEGTFALEVRGDSMVEDHICSGDYVLIERTDSVRNGEIVVALVDGAETTLKRYYDEGGRVRLQPANSEMKPIYVDKSQLEIQGKVLAVLRKYH
ncbi:MAG TPA: transcriptional repressor LexA [Bryobacteraceae bacterium]|jgi:repressor LexA